MLAVITGPANELPFYSIVKDEAASQATVWYADWVTEPRPVRRGASRFAGDDGPIVLFAGIDFYDPNAPFIHFDPSTPSPYVWPGYSE